MTDSTNVASTQWVELENLDEAYAAAQDRYDHVLQAPRGTSRNVQEVETIDSWVGVWQQSAGRGGESGKIRRLIVLGGSPEAVRERLFELGYSPEKFHDDHGEIIDGYAPTRP